MTLEARKRHLRAWTVLFVVLATVLAAAWLNRTPPAWMQHLPSALKRPATP
jgi:hypothetical protein